MSKIRKLVIPAAGVGTRFLPATKAQPKEMLPILDKPIIQIIVEDAVRSGIEDIIIITGKTKRAIEDHFDRDEYFENLLIDVGKKRFAEMIKNIAYLANFIYIRQKGPYGNGTPVLNAKRVIGKEPFAVVWGDDLWMCQKKPQLKQLIEVYEKYSEPVISAMYTDSEGTKKYGIIDGIEIQKDIYQVKKLVEKPGPKNAPSNIASVGGYILTPDIFDALEQTKPGKGGEVWLVDAIAKLLKRRRIYAKIINGKYLDCGTKLGWLKANIEYGLQDADIHQKLKQFLKNLTERRL